MTDPDPKGEHTPTPIHLHNGTYTVNCERLGSHYTVKVYTVRKGDFAGRRMIAVLTGSCNETDYRAVAFWNDADRCAEVWKRFRSPQSHMRCDDSNWQKSWSKVEKKIAVMLSLALRRNGGYWGADGYTLLKEGRCIICNRKLTTPESITLGIGPDCAKRYARL